MSLAAQLALKERRVSYSVYVAGQPVKPLSIQVDLGYDVASSSATVILAEVPDVLQLRQELEIWLGWNGFTIPRFKGYIDDDERGYFPFGHQVRASGYSKLMQMKYPETVTYSSQTDTAIADNLASRAGVVNRVIEGSGTTLGTIQPVTLTSGSPPFSLMNLLDQTFGYKTFDVSDGVVVRLPISSRPATTAAFAFTEGGNVKKIDRKQGNVDEIKNKVNVFGLPQENVSQPMAEREAANPLVPNPPEFNPHDLHSDLVETLAIASAQALRIMGEVNGLPDTVIIDTWGHPNINPGQTVSILSSKIGLTTATNYLVKHVSERVDAQGFNSRITCERRIGDLGTELGRRPIPLFSYRVSAETFVSGKLYTVTCDAAASFDPDSPFTDLTFAWSNNKNADTGSASVYTTHFTEAQMRDATPPTITLVVNDADATSGSGTIVKTISVTNDPINARALYVAASSRAEATPDGGETWNTWTPGAGTVISTPEISAVGLGLFGLSNGKLMATLDYLVSAPTETHDFGSAINNIWVNEADGNRVVVVLANGEVWLTNNMGDIASSTWTMLTDLPAQAFAIQESAANQGQFRVATSNQLIITFDSFGASGELANLGGGATAKRIVTSPFSNYVSGDGGDKVKREDGVTITGITDSNVRGLAHHIRDDKLFAGSEAGHTWQKAAGATSVTAKVTLPTSPGQINHMINDGDNERIFYVATEGGLYKTDDEFTSANMMRDYSAGGVDGLMVGRESLTLVNPANTGARVYVAGRAPGSPHIPIFAFTNNVFAASPLWFVNTTGLPAGIADGSGVQFAYDPFNSSSIGFYSLNNSGSMELYKNTAMITGGSWSKVFDTAAFNTATGLSATSISIIDFDLSIAAQDFIMLMVLPAGVGSGAGSGVRSVHSHDNGATWHGAVEIEPSFPTGTGGGWRLALGQHNPNRAYAMLSSGGIGLPGAFRSDDGGHTWTRVFAGESPLDMVTVPVGGNLTDSILLGTGAASPSGTKRSIDSGATYAVIDSAIFTRIILLNANLTGKGLAYATGGTVYTSGNGGDSWTAYTGALGAVSPASGVNAVSMLNDSNLYIATMSAPEDKVFTSQDGGITWVSRRGNLTPTLYHETSVMYDIAVDFAS